MESDPTASTRQTKSAWIGTALLKERTQRSAKAFRFGSVVAASTPATPTPRPSPRVAGAAHSIARAGRSRRSMARSTPAILPDFEDRFAPGVEPLLYSQSRRDSGDGRRWGLGMGGKPSDGLSRDRSRYQLSRRGNGSFAHAQDRVVGRRKRSPFAMVVSNCSGAGGAELARRGFGRVFVPEKRALLGCFVSGHPALWLRTHVRPRPHISHFRRNGLMPRARGCN
jgi:hypothetical protein